MSRSILQTISFFERAASSRQRAIALGILAVLSALATTYLPVEALSVFDVPVAPGVFFGLVVLVGVRAWVSRSIFDCVAVLLLSLVAWVAAVHTSIFIYESIAAAISELTGSGPRRTLPRHINYVLALCGAFGGLVGSSILALAVSAVSREFRSFENWARLTMCGTAAGVLLEFAVLPTEGRLPIHVGSYLPLYLVWQTTVAASIRYGLGGRGESALPSAARQPPSPASE
jgi:hypothetical protein